MSQVNAEVVQAALSSILDGLMERTTMPAVRLSNAKTRVVRLMNLIDGQRTDREICGAVLNADSRPCQSERGHSGDHWTPSDQADKPMWWSDTDRENGSER